MTKRKKQPRNANLCRAKTEKNDEYYTRMCDIDAELSFYAEEFRDKTVFLPCDDPLWSNFFKWFDSHFAELGLEKLICSYYNGGRPVAATFITKGEDGQPVRSRELIVGGGDFRSERCGEFFDEADIVVSNPPFSLMSEFLGAISAHGCDYIVVAPMTAMGGLNAVSLIQSRRMFPGVTQIKKFETPPKAGEEQGGIGMVNALWLTSFWKPIDRIYWEVETPYDPKLHPRYVNIDAIDVSVSTTLPCDYDGLMGVPLSFFTKWDPSAYEILGTDKQFIDLSLIDPAIEFPDNIRVDDQCVVLHRGRPKNVFRRLIIRRIQPNAINPQPNTSPASPDTPAGLTVVDPQPPISPSPAPTPATPDDSPGLAADTPQQPTSPSPAPLMAIGVDAQ